MNKYLVQRWIWIEKNWELREHQSESVNERQILFIKKKENGTFEGKERGSYGGAAKKNISSVDLFKCIHNTYVQMMYNVISY